MDINCGLEADPSDASPAAPGKSLRVVSLQPAAPSISLWCRFACSGIPLVTIPVRPLSPIPLPFVLSILPPVILSSPPMLVPQTTVRCGAAAAAIRLAGLALRCDKHTRFLQGRSMDLDQCDNVHSGVASLDLMQSWFQASSSYLTATGTPSLRASSWTFDHQSCIWPRLMSGFVVKLWMINWQYASSSWQAGLATI